MSKLSIYEDHWINMVFEGKNKEYGAYQLRHDSNKTTLYGFLMGILIVISLVSIAILIKNLNTTNVIPATPPIILDEIIQVTLVDTKKPEVPKKLAAQISKKSEPEKEIKKQLFNPEIVKPIDANDNIATNKENKPTESANTNNNIVGTETSGTSTESTTGTGIAEGKIPETNINTTNTLDKLPEFPGGIEKFYSYVGNNFNKLEFDGAKTIKIYVYFVIEKDGSMTDIKVIRDPGFGLGQEAIRVLKSIKTKWSPGIINGKSVRTSYNLPIVVKRQ